MSSTDRDRHHDARVWGSGIGALGIDREGRTAGEQPAPLRAPMVRDAALRQLQELQNQIKRRDRIE